MTAETGAVRPVGQRCPCCGETDAFLVEHDNIEDHPLDCPAEHGVCRNCDHGLCCEAC